MEITQHLASNPTTDYLSRSCKFIIYLPLLSCLFLPVTVYSLSLDNVPVITLNHGQISIYRDKSKQLTFDDIRQPQIKSQFKSLEGNLSKGYIPDTFWLHFSLNNLDSQSLIRWLEIIPPHLDNIDLYHVNPKGQVEHRQAGDFLPQSAKEESYRSHLFKVNFEPGEHEIYLRLQTSSIMVAILKLWQPDAFNLHQRNSYFAFGLYFSLILTVLLFNLANWIISRRIIFIVYVTYLTLNSMQWLGINGFIAEFIFPETPLLANLTQSISLSLAATMGFIFFSMVFELRKYHVYIYRLNQLGATVGVVTAIATPLGHYQSFAPLLLLIAIISLTLTPLIMIRLWRTQEIWNRLLVIAHSSFSILVGLNILSSLALIPFNEPIIYAGMASNIFHILILHFAIMLHYNRLEIMHKESLKQAVILQNKMAIEQNYREEQSQLLAMITHEIRTPIAVINAANESLRLIDNRTTTNKDRTLRYNRIHNAVMRMNMVMEMVLAQKENENLPFEKIVVDLTKLTLDVIELSGEDALQRVVFNMPAENITVNADLSLLRIALINLLGNALKYSPQNSRIDIHLQSADSEKNTGITWIIEDQGTGVPVEMREKIFEKYQRGDERRNQAGMGLGLFLVDRIVKRHSGSITVENSPSGGAHFCLSLPNNT